MSGPTNKSFGAWTDIRCLDASGAAVDRHPARLKAIEKLIRQDLPAMEGHAFHSAAVASLQAAPCGFRSSGTVAQLRSEKS